METPKGLRYKTVVLLPFGHKKFISLYQIFLELQFRLGYNGEKHISKKVDL